MTATRGPVPAVPPGLCGSCVHALLNETRRGTVYLRCGAAGTVPELPRYPTLPVLRCVGYTPV